MAAFGDIPSNNWSAGLYYKRKHEEHMAREREQREAREKGDAAVIDADYVVIPSPQQQEMK
jgi:hypothetical protein